MKEPVKIIFDTDMDTDCDDMGALALLIRFVKRGKADLCGIVVDAPCIGGAVACERLCRYEGIATTIGTVYEEDFSYEESERYRRYRDHRKTLPDSIFYNRFFASEEKKCDKDYMDAVSAYRKMLSEAQDNSVVIVAVGFMTAIERLFESGADEYSKLNGYDLFSKKVKTVVSMGCADYPETDNYNFNYNMDRVGAKSFFDRCPCPIVVSPDGEDVVTGHTFTKKLPKSDPVREAYEIYNGKNTGRSSWDLLCVLYAINPETVLFTKEYHGQVVYDETNNHVFWKDGQRKDSQIKLAIPSVAMAEMLEIYLTERNG